MAKKYPNLILNKKEGLRMKTFPFPYMFTQLVVPIAVRIAVMTDARICSVHLMVSFLLILMV